MKHLSNFIVLHCKLSLSNTKANNPVTDVDRELATCYWSSLLDVTDNCFLPSRRVILLLTLQESLSSFQLPYIITSSNGEVTLCEAFNSFKYF